MNDTARLLTSILLFLGACDGGPSRQVAEAPSAAAIVWDAEELGAGAPAVRSATSFSRRAGAPDTLWHRLATYRGSFLRHWRQAFDAAEAPTPSEVADALNELIVAVNGPAGFWRKTVAKGWLGCEADTDSEACRELAALDKDLTPGDTLLRQLDTLEPKQAAAFLARHEARILSYLDTCVPREASAAALGATPLYRKHLAHLLDSGVSATRLSRNDL